MKVLLRVYEGHCSYMHIHITGDGTAKILCGHLSYL